MKFFEPTPDAIRALERLANEIPGIQGELVKNHKQLQRSDRAAHQQQIAGGKVLLTVAGQLPAELAGLGVFDGAKHDYVGIGRISTGLGCPHVETDPDFLGIMLAFRDPEGRRIDFIGLNDPASPTDTAEDFMALLWATAESAGTDVPLGGIGKLDLGNLVVSQTKLVRSLVHRLGPVRALAMFRHVFAQTGRTLVSSSAYQQYWTGIVRANDTPGKFTLVPTEDVNRHRDASPGERYLSQDCNRRQTARDLEFRLYWIPFLDEDTTPMKKPTMGWQESHRVQVGSVSFPQTNSELREARLAALLASEMGANPGNWVSRKGEGPAPAIPATEFTAARSFVYRKSQQERHALPEAMYESFFANGEINPELAAELIRRYNEKRQSGHGSPAVGDLSP
jgi:hypothetical protein